MLSVISNACIQTHRHFGQITEQGRLRYASGACRRRTFWTFCQFRFPLSNCASRWWEKDICIQKGVSALEESWDHASNVRGRGLIPYWDLQSIFINFPNSNGAQPTDNAFRIDERWVTALIDNIKRWKLLTCLRLLRADGGVKTSEFSQRSRILVLMTKEVCLKAQGGSPQITDPISYYRLSCDLYYRN